jgi:hypothetical protein
MQTFTFFIWASGAISGRVREGAELQPESLQEDGLTGVRADQTPQAKFSLIGGLEDHTGAL